MNGRFQITFARRPTHKREGRDASFLGRFVVTVASICLPVVAALGLLAAAFLVGSVLLVVIFIGAVLAVGYRVVMRNTKTRKRHPDTSAPDRRLN
jgi:hypothetical protein